MNKLGEFLKKIRIDKNLSLRDFAKILDLSHAYLDKLEKGIDTRSNASVVPTIDTLQKISLGLKMSLKELLINTGYLKNSDDLNGFKIDDLQNKTTELLNLLDVTEVVALIKIKSEGYNLNVLQKALKLIKSIRERNKQC